MWLGHCTRASLLPSPSGQFTGKSTSWWRPLQFQDGITAVAPERPPATQARLARNLIIRETNEAFHYLIAITCCYLHPRILPSPDDLVGCQAAPLMGTKEKEKHCGLNQEPLGVSHPRVACRMVSLE